MSVSCNFFTWGNYYETLDIACDCCRFCPYVRSAFRGRSEKRATIVAVRPKRPRRRGTPARPMITRTATTTVNKPRRQRLRRQVRRGSWTREISTATLARQLPPRPRPVRETARTERWFPKSGSAGSGPVSLICRSRSGHPRSVSKRISHALSKFQNAVRGCLSGSRALRPSLVAGIASFFLEGSGIQMALPKSFQDREIGIYAIISGPTCPEPASACVGQVPENNMNSLL